ncbi:hypothetical protein HQ531_02580 [bacterium]|nr:hypothetical protein [bacterium]
MKLREINTNQKVFVGAAIIVLLVVFSGVYSLRQLNNISQLTIQLYDHPLTVSNALLNIQSDINAMHRSMKDVAVAETDEMRSNISGKWTRAGSVEKLFGRICTIFRRFNGCSKCI